MKNKSSKIALALYIIACWGCLLQGKSPSLSTDKDLERFANLLEGSFSSKAQSEKDTAYFDIRLNMKRIWGGRTDGIWLYVEQALATKQDKPYRQRVYRLAHPDKNVFTSDIYTLKSPQDFIGLQQDATKEAGLTKENIELKDGCTVTLRFDGTGYSGGTEADKCPSDLRGASYATTEISLKDGVLESWDRGYDASGKQVWGATKGGYVFIKGR